MSVSLALLAAAATSFTLPGGSPVCRMPAAARAPALIAMGAKKSKSRFGDDGTREDGVDLQGAMEAGISGGFFSNFKWGTEVDVGPKDEPKPTKKGMKKKVVGDGAGSDRGIGGNFAYRNTESARLSDSDDSQRLRKQRLDAYINSTEEAADTTFGKIIAGSLIFVLIALLGGVVAYYGVDGLIAAPNRMSF